MTHCDLGCEYSQKREEKGKIVMLNGIRFCCEFSERDI